jgi:hypothetical protein
MRFVMDKSFYSTKYRSSKSEPLSPISFTITSICLRTIGKGFVLFRSQRFTLEMTLPVFLQTAIESAPGACGFPLQARD